MSSPTVLVVDDEANIRKSVRMCLEEAGYVVLQASNGSEALEQITKDAPDLMLLDLAMPVFDGMSVLAEMHKLWAHYPTRVIVVTAHGSVKTAIQAIRLGASDFLEKPFSPEDLRLSIASVLREGPPHFRTAGEGYIESLERVRQALCARRFDLAERELGRAEIINNNDAAYLNLAGVVQEAHGRIESAHYFYSRAAAREPRYRAARQNINRLDELKRTGKTTLSVALGGDLADDQPQGFHQTAETH
ncbi:MAG TPA: response regulator [Tepidisphaeraceae bacterium]|nr:response regulator [Tepidisphaeraceae bacterium]